MKEYSLIYFIKGDYDLRIKDFYTLEDVKRFIEYNYDKIKVFRFISNKGEFIKTYHE